MLKAKTHASTTAPVSSRRCWPSKDVSLREKTLWRLLYESAARAKEVLGLDVDDIDLANRRAR